MFVSTELAYHINKWWLWELYAYIIKATSLFTITKMHSIIFLYYQFSFWDNGSIIPTSNILIFGKERTCFLIIIFKLYLFIRKTKRERERQRDNERKRVC